MLKRKIRMTVLLETEEGGNEIESCCDNDEPC